MKVKIFKHWDYDAQEVEMNNWFAENPNIKIIKITQSSIFSTSTMYTLISVFYKPIYKKQDTGPH